MMKALSSIAITAAIWSVGMGAWRVLEGTFNGVATIVSIVAIGLLLGSFIYFMGWVLEKWARKKVSDTES
jgi:hypothetical protein